MRVTVKPGVFVIGIRFKAGVITVLLGRFGFRFGR